MTKTLRTLSALALLLLSACGSGPRYTTPTAVVELYQLMYDAHSLMSRENVPYWVDGGTLIGAVRHQGIIPWDDDLDICIYPGSETAFADLEGKFKKLGYRLEKIIVEEAQPPHIGYKVFPMGQSYPFLDVLFTKKKDGRIYYPTDALGAYKRRENDQIFMREDELLPLKKVKFGSFEVMAPNDSSTFLKTLYGADFMEVAFQTHVHTGGAVEKKKVLIDEWNRLPAQPIDKVQFNRIELLDR